jgi:glycosyltransferase involved in cell wall biosynthesis
MKQLSIIIPVFNVEKYIYDCLESVSRQEQNDYLFEAIIINDGERFNRVR